jgi:putative flippase GtrA
LKGREVFRFLLVGAASAGTQFGVLFLFDVCAFSINRSISASYVASVLVHFLGNKYFTFRSVSNVDAIEVLRYLSVALINYLITICIVWFFIEMLDSNKYIATMASISTTVGIGFLLSKLWVFKK